MSMDPRRKKITQEFSIKNYMATRATLDAKVESPTFPGGQLQWSIVIYPRGKDGQNGFGAYLHLSATPKELKTVVVDHIRVELEADRPLGVGLNSNVVMQVGDEEGLSLDDTRFHPGIESRNLTVYVKVFIHREDNEILFENFTTMREDLDLTDFTVHSKDRCQRFHTHKFVLATRIPDVYRKKFHRQNGGAAKNQAEVNCSGQTIAALMDFLYTNEISTPATMELFQLANEWQLNRLVVICGNQMADKLNVKNVAKILQIASLWRLPKLKFAAEKFVEDHKSDASEIVKSGGQSNSAVIGQVGFEGDSE